MQPAHHWDMLRQPRPIIREALTNDLKETGGPGAAATKSPSAFGLAGGLDRGLESDTTEQAGVLLREGGGFKSWSFALPSGRREATPPTHFFPVILVLAMLGEVTG
jgi:hypothetical protein